MAAPKTKQTRRPRPLWRAPSPQHLQPTPWRSLQGRLPPRQSRTVGIASWFVALFLPEITRKQRHKQQESHRDIDAGIEQNAGAHGDYRLDDKPQRYPDGKGEE